MYKAAIFAQKAFAKVILNKKLNTIRVLVTFNNTDKITQRNANYATGDLCSVTDNAQYVQHSIAQALNTAKKVLRTDNIVIVD
jgi:hypothetical protein